MSPQRSHGDQASSSRASMARRKATNTDKSLASKHLLTSSCSPKLNETGEAAARSLLEALRWTHSPMIVKFVGALGALRSLVFARSAIRDGLQFQRNSDRNRARPYPPRPSRRRDHRPTGHARSPANRGWLKPCHSRIPPGIETTGQMDSIGSFHCFAQLQVELASHPELRAPPAPSV